MLAARPTPRRIPMIVTAAYVRQSAKKVRYELHTAEINLVLYVHREALTVPFPDTLDVEIHVPPQQVGVPAADTLARLE